MSEIITRWCPLCKREVPKYLVERHHIKTREVDKFATVPICNSCHKTIHALFSNAQIKDGLDSVHALLANEQFSRAVKFIRKQAPTSVIKVKKANTRKKR